MSLSYYVNGFLGLVIFVAILLNQSWSKVTIAIAAALLITQALVDFGQRFFK